MFRNYCTIIIRNLWRNKLYTLVNIIGLGVGIATIVWGYQDYRYCTSFDDFHKDGKNIFRVLTKSDNRDYLQGICPGTLDMVVKNDFPVSYFICFKVKVYSLKSYIIENTAAIFFY